MRMKGFIKELLIDLLAVGMLLVAIFLILYNEEHFGGTHKGIGLLAICFMIIALIPMEKQNNKLKVLLKEREEEKKREEIRFLLQVIREEEERVRKND